MATDESPMTDSIQVLLDKTTVRDIHQGRGLIVVPSSSSIGDAMQILAKNGITSAPVYDASSDSYLGFVDVLDIAVDIVKIFAENYEQHPHLYNPAELRKQFLLPITSVVNASDRDPFLPVDINWSLSFLINNFLKYGIHRVPVVEDDKIVGVVAQSDVLRFLQQHRGSLTSEFHTLAQLGLAEGPVISIPQEAPLMRAFTHILTSKVSGIAVINERGQLVNNLSVSDLKGITETTFFKLEAPIHQVFSYATSKLPVVRLRPWSTFGDLLDVLATTGVHRAYVVDDNDKPVNVVTLTTILQRFAAGAATTTTA